MFKIEEYTQYHPLDLLEYCNTQPYFLDKNSSRFSQDLINSVATYCQAKKFGNIALIFTEELIPAGHCSHKYRYKNEILEDIDLYYSLTRYEKICKDMPEYEDKTRAAIFATMGNFLILGVY
jgi:hypothetical protein